MSDDWKQRAERAEKQCAAMREAFKSFECGICDENHKFKEECQACLFGEPSYCTCAQNELVDCPCCMEGEYAPGYRELRAAIKDGAGSDYLSPDQVKELVKPLVDALEWICMGEMSTSDSIPVKALRYAKEKNLL